MHLLLSGFLLSSFRLTTCLCAAVALPAKCHECQWPDDKTKLHLQRFQVPPNGLVVYTGTILTDEGKEKKVNIDFEPFKPINTSLYLCDNKFHTEALNELLESDNKYGFSALVLIYACIFRAPSHDISLQRICIIHTAAQLASELNSWVYLRQGS